MTLKHKIPCPTCGTEHSNDCPNRFARAFSEPCSCKDGCNECDWAGVKMWTEGGHKWLSQRPK